MEIKHTNAEIIENKIKDIITFIGDNPDREGLKETPKRIIKSWNKLFGGYNKKPENILKTFKEGACNEMIVLKNIEFYSTCEHHFLPFIGKISIGYIPNKRVVGISKLARLVEIYSRRLQIQERMTTSIANTIMKYLKPKGVMIICEAQHLCMTMRGVEKQNSIMITSAIRGVFEKNEVRQEFLRLIT